LADRSSIDERLLHDPAMRAYFNALPAYVKENIYMSATNLESVEQLKAIAAGLMEQRG
jgi:hypothetical protein